MPQYDIHLCITTYKILPYPGVHNAALPSGEVCDLPHPLAQDLLHPGGGQEVHGCPKSQGGTSSYCQ